MDVLGYLQGWLPGTEAGLGKAAIDMLITSAVMRQTLLVALVTLRCVVDAIYLMTSILNTKGIVVLQCAVLALASYAFYAPPAALQLWLARCADLVRPGVFGLVWLMVVTVLFSILPARLLSLIHGAKKAFDIVWLSVVVYILMY